MSKTANNSFGSDKSGIVIWKHNTMGHMDNGVEEQIARLVKKQEEGLVNSTSMLSFASELGAVDKPKRGFLKRFFGKKEASPVLPSDAGSSLVIQDKSSSFETNRSRASSQEDVRSGKTDFRVFRDGKGAAVVALSDGRNFPDLARRAREAGFPDLARQIEIAVPRQPRAATRASRTKSVSQPSATEIIDRVRARNQGRVGGGTSEAERHGEIPIRSVEDLKAHRAELARNRSQLASLRQKEAAPVPEVKLAVEEARQRPTRKEGAEQAEPLERSAMVTAWLQSGNITGNPVLYPDTSPDAPGVPTSIAPPHTMPFSPDAPLPNRGLGLEGRDPREMEKLLGSNNRGVGLEGRDPRETEKVLGSNGRLHDEGLHEMPDGHSEQKAIRSPLSKPSAPVKTPDPRLLGPHPIMLRSVSDRPGSDRPVGDRLVPGDPIDGPKGLIRANSETLALILPKQPSDPSLEADPGVGKFRRSDGHRSSLRGSPLPSPEPAPVGLKNGSPPGLLVSPVKGLGFEPKRATSSPGLPWSPLDARGDSLPSPRPLPGPLDDATSSTAGPKQVTRQLSGKSEGRQEAIPASEGERYDPAQWHKYLQERSAQVLPNLAAEAADEVLPGARAAPPPSDAAHPIRALPLPLPPDLHRLPSSFGPSNWPYKSSEPSPDDFDASGGATPRSSCLTEPHSPSSPLRDLLLSPHAHMVETWHAASTYSG